MMEYKVDNNLNFNCLPSGLAYTEGKSLVQTTSGGALVGDFNENMSCWDYWQYHYYPSVIHESYPIYLQDRSKDKGKQAFEIIKMLKDKKIVKLDTVSNFIDAMDALIKIL